MTVTFNTSAPASGWGFSLIDLDNDQVEISAIDASGNTVSNSVIDSWLVEVFDADPEDLAGIKHALQRKPPFWDASNATLMGYNLSDVMDPVIYNREITSVSKDAEGASAWFAPNISLNSMTFTFCSKGDNYTPSYHFYALSCMGSIATNSISGTIYDESLATGLSNSAVHLYEGSTLKDTQTTDASGLYAFNVVDGNL